MENYPLLSTDFFPQTVYLPLTLPQHLNTFEYKLLCDNPSLLPAFTPLTLTYLPEYRCMARLGFIP